MLLTSGYQSNMNFKPFYVGSKYGTMWLKVIGRVGH